MATRMWDSELEELLQELLDDESAGQDVYTVLGNLRARFWRRYHNDAGRCYHRIDDPRFDCWNPPIEDILPVTNES